MVLRVDADIEGDETSAQVGLLLFQQPPESKGMRCEGSAHVLFPTRIDETVCGCF